MTITNDFFNRLIGTWENKINGQWQDDFGWNFIAQPKLAVGTIDDFSMRFDQMHETITFKEIGQARNIGVTGEAGFWRSLAYEISIKNTQGDGIHHEMGHFLLKVMENGETAEQLRGDIIRQATIPRANAMMTLGELRPERLNDIDTPIHNQFYDALPKSLSTVFQASIDAEFLNANSQIQALQGPNFRSPLTWLKAILAASPVGVDWVFSFREDKEPSQMASGERVINPVSIGNLLSDFWIAKRHMTGIEIDILQYVQKVDLKFNGMSWPHVAINTLIKQN